MLSRSTAQSALLVCVLFAAPPPPSLAQIHEPQLRLESLLNEALASNPTLIEARLEAEARLLEGVHAASLVDPVASVTVLPYSVATGDGVQRTEWSIMQMLPWPGTLSLRRAAAGFAAVESRHQADALALDLVLQIRQAYHELYLAQRTDSLIRRFATALDAFLESAAVMYEVGRGPQAAILQAQVDQERLYSRLLDTEIRKENALRRLSRLVDRPDLLVIDDIELYPPDLPSLAEATIDDAIRRNPELQALDAAEARAETEVDLAMKARYPELGLGLMYMDMPPGSMPGMAGAERVASGFGFTVSATLPIRGEKLRALRKATEIRLRQVQERQRAAATTARSIISELVTVTRREAESVELFRTRLRPQTESAMASVLAAYTTGEADYAAFLEAERARFEVAIGLEESIIRYLNALALLDRALGKWPIEMDSSASSSAETRDLQ